MNRKSSPHNLDSQPEPPVDGDAPTAAHLSETAAHLSKTAAQHVDPSTVGYRSDTAGRKGQPDGDADFADYEILSIIGRGGMGIVYRARQVRLNRIVALKTILAGSLATADEVKRFRQEAEAAARLDHPGIVPVYEISDSDEQIFFSMGYVEGESLRERLQRSTLAPRDASTLVRDLADAVAFAHRAGVVHRDLKPGNVLLDQQGNPRISDFGLAKLSDGEQLTMTGDVLGTPSYMAPEQAAGDGRRIGPSCDVYALGAILYACLGGQAPFRAESAAATLHLVLHAVPTPLRQLRDTIPQDLETICSKCLEKEPSSRYESAEQLRDELQRFLDGRPVLARPVSAWTHFRRWRKRNPLVAGLLLAVLVSSLLGTAISTYFGVLAQTRARRAEAGFHAATGQSKLALKAVRTVIHTVQERLKTVPEAREVRRKLLVEVLDDLEEVATGYLAQSSVDRESAQVFAELGTLFSEIGDDSGANAVRLSDQHFRKSIEIYQQLVADDPDDDSLQDALMNVALDYGDTSREYRRFKEAIWAHRIARTVAANWHQRQPDNLKVRLAYVQTTEALGEALIRSGGGFAEGRTYCLEALELAVSYSQAHPSIGVNEVVAVCYCTVGDMHRIAGELPEAEAAYRKMCDLSEELMKLDPDNPQRILDRSSDFERLGDLYAAQGDFEKARESLEECVRLSEAYLADDPSNLFRLQQATWGYQKVAEVYRILGDQPRADWALGKLNEIRTRLAGASSDPAP